MNIELACPVVRVRDHCLRIASPAGSFARRRMNVQSASVMARKNLTRFAWLSVGAAIATIALKLSAYLITDSVGLLSDALESLVNLAAALMALAMLTVAARAPDEMHAFGYSKAEYFSSGVEGALILIAAAGILWTALPRLLRLSR